MQQTVIIVQVEGPDGPEDIELPVIQAYRLFTELKTIFESDTATEHLNRQQSIADAFKELQGDLFGLGWRRV